MRKDGQRSRKSARRRSAVRTRSVFARRGMADRVRTAEQVSLPLGKVEAAFAHPTAATP